jgi:hypothetical protein
MIVTRAMDLWRKLPNRPALEILDRALLGHRDEHPDFAHGGPLMTADSHHLLPPSPFSELLRRAFAPDLDAQEVLLMALLRPPQDPALLARLRMVEEAWRSRVIEPFGARYRLWSGAAPVEGATPGPAPTPEPPPTEFTVPGLAHGARGGRAPSGAQRRREAAGTRL